MNRIKITLAALLVLATGSLYAQTDEFYSEIKQFMTDNRAEYENIVKSYFAGQELSLDDYTLLYYGYTYTDNYKPDYVSNKADSLINKKEYQQAYEVLLEENRQDPTSLETLFDLMNLADVLGKSSDSQKFQISYINLVKAIMQSGGDGSSAENAIHVNRTSDQFQLLSVYFKAVSIVSKEFSGSTDKITIKDSDGNVKVLYFDYSRYLEVSNAK